jgi:hypothetical protein
MNPENYMVIIKVRGKKDLNIFLKELSKDYGLGEIYGNGRDYLINAVDIPSFDHDPLVESLNGLPDVEYSVVLGAPPVEGVRAGRGMFPFHARHPQQIGNWYKSEKSLQGI